jgi:ketosteroid isomerase-like protein
VTDKVVEEYLDAVATHNWDRMRAAVREDVVRIGPFGDTYIGRDTYLEFLSDLMPTLPGYSMDVARVTYLDGDRRAVAELSETVTVDGAPLVTPEALLFDLDEDGRISRIEIFTRRA